MSRVKLHILNEVSSLKKKVLPELALHRICVQNTKIEGHARWNGHSNDQCLLLSYEKIKLITNMFEEDMNNQLKRKYFCKKSLA